MSATDKGDTSTGYRCSNCGERFDYEDGWTDEDALAEARANGFDTADDLVVVCDDCYRAMGFGGCPDCGGRGYIGVFSTTHGAPCPRGCKVENGGTSS